MDSIFHILLANLVLRHSLWSFLFRVPARLKADCDVRLSHVRLQTGFDYIYKFYIDSKLCKPERFEYLYCILIFAHKWRNYLQSLTWNPNSIGIHDAGNYEPNQKVSDGQYQRHTMYRRHVPSGPWSMRSLPFSRGINSHTISELLLLTLRSKILLPSTRNKK